MATKREYTIQFNEPFYELVEKRYLLWFIPYWSHVGYDSSLERMEKLYKELTGKKWK